MRRSSYWSAGFWPGTMRIFPSLRAALSVAMFALLAASCSGDDDGAPVTTATPSAPEPASLTFLAAFRPQANLPFVGVYVAQDKGYFAEEQLTVDIQHLTRGSALTLTVQGRAQVTTADAPTLLKRRAEAKLPVVAIALIGQEGQQGWISLRESGIARPQDWAGKRIGYRNTAPPELAAILEIAGLKADAVKTTNIGFQPPQLLIEGLVDVYPVFLSNEPDIVRRTLGKEVNVFKASDYGVPTLGLTYATSEEYLRDHPDVLARFLRAALRGIEFAKARPDEAVDIVMKYAPQEERTHQRYMLDTELAAAGTGAARDGGIGWMTRDQWRALYDTLLKYGALKGSIDDIGSAFADGPLRTARGRN